MKKRLIFVLLVVVLSLLVFGCSKPAPTAVPTEAVVEALVEEPTAEEPAAEAPAAEEPVAEASAAEEVPAVASDGKFVIGSYLQLTGGNSAYGNEANNAIKLAIEEINAAGGLNGEEITYIPYDTQGLPEEAVKVVSKMLSNDNVDLIIGSVNSSEVLAAAGKVNDAGVLHFGLGTASSWMAKGWPYVFRATMNNDIAAPVTADMVKTLGITTIGIFHGQDDAALQTSKTFADACKERGIEVVANESYDPGDTDFSAQIASILSKNPQSVYIAVIGETGPIIVKQLRQYGYSGIIFDKESFMFSQIEIAGEAASNYIAFANPYVTYATTEDCDIPIVQEFMKKYRDEYGSEVKTDSAYRGWDTMMVIQEAAKRAGKNDTQALIDAIYTITDMPGLGGVFDYSKKNNEGYQTFNSFILIDKKNILFDKWFEEGGYEKYKEATGNAF